MAGRRSTRRQFPGEAVGAVVAATVAGIIAPRRAILALAAGARPVQSSCRAVGASRWSAPMAPTIGRYSPFTPGQFVADVALSPDGTRVAFGIFTAGTTAPGGSDIAVAPTDPTAGSFTIIVPRDRPGMQLAAPCWSSDGTALAFEGVGLGADGKPVMFTDWVAADGSSGRQRLVEDGHLPTLSPDGREVAYVRSKPDGDSLWTRRAGRRPRARNPLGEPVHLDHRATLQSGRFGHRVRLAPSNGRCCRRNYAGRTP